MVVRAAAIAAVLVTPSGTRAQEAQTDADTERARVLFDEGLAFVDEGDYEQAADRFEQAYEIRPGTGVAFNLASSWVHLDRRADAAELLREVVDDPEASAQVRTMSEELLAEIEPQLGELTVHVEGEPEGAEVSVDDEPLPREEWGVARPVDPGTHEVASSRGGDRLSMETVEVEEGGASEVRLNVPAPAGSSGGSVADKWWFWAAIGGAVLGMVLIAAAVTSADDDDDGTMMRPGGMPLLSW